MTCAMGLRNEEDEESPWDSEVVFIFVVTIIFCYGF
jgi:hypothetical protein